MTRVIADDGLKAQLKGFSESLGICDESGKMVGYFQPLPVPVHDREVYDWAKAEFAKEDLTEARQSIVWYTTEEVLEHLRSLDVPGVLEPSSEWGNGGHLGKCLEPQRDHGRHRLD